MAAIQILSFDSPEDADLYRKAWNANSGWNNRRSGGLNDVTFRKVAENIGIEELRNIISFTRGPSAWDELIKTEADIRKKRQNMIYAQQELRQKWIEGIAVTGLILLIVCFLGFMAYLFLNR